MSNQNLNKSSKNDQLRVIASNELSLKKNDKKLSSASFSISIRTLLQNWRQGTVGCKTRAEVAYSNKKPWKQKGTGRARAGSRRSPLWIGGGIVFGPQPRVRKLKTNKLLKRSILTSMLSDLVENNKVFSLNYEVLDKPKTSASYEILKNANLHNEKKLIFLADPNDLLSQAAFANLSNVEIVLYDELNVFNISRGAFLILLEKDLNLFKNMVQKWI